MGWGARVGSLGRRGLVGLAVVLLVGGVGTGVFAGRPVVGLVAAGVVFLVVVVLAGPTDTKGDGDGDDGGSRGSSWEVIPSWQYAGRHVESGGLTRDEQERALQDITDQAEDPGEPRGR